MSEFKKGDFVIIRADLPLYCDPYSSPGLKNWVKYAGTVCKIDEVRSHFECNDQFSLVYALIDPLTSERIPGLWRSKQLVHMTDVQFHNFMLKLTEHIHQKNKSIDQVIDELYVEQGEYERIAEIAKITRAALHAVDNGESATPYFKKIAQLATGEFKSIRNRLINWLLRDCHTTMVAAWISFVCFALAIFTGSRNWLNCALAAMIAILIL